MANPIIRFQVGGPAFHPVEAQARLLAGELGEHYICQFIEGAAAFEDLDAVSLLVPMGLHWTGMTAKGLAYTPLASSHLEALRRYVGSGRPLLCYHGGIASYDDCPAYGALLGYQWRWGVTFHTPVAAHPITVSSQPHPLLEDVGDYTLTDELYYNLQISPDMEIDVLGHGTFHDSVMPVIFAGRGGRIPGAGWSVYIGNGHDLRAWECPALRRLCVNAVRWLTSEVSSLPSSHE